MSWDPAEFHMMDARLGEMDSTLSQLNSSLDVTNSKLDLLVKAVILVVKELSMHRGRPDGFTGRENKIMNMIFQEIVYMRSPDEKEVEDLLNRQAGLKGGDDVDTD